MYNGYARTQDETARDVITRRSCIEMEGERMQATVPESRPRTSRTDLQPHCMATEAAPRLVGPGEASHHQQRERRKNRIVGMIAALACFGLCWMTASLIAEAVGDELLGAWWGKSIGIGPGWLYIRMAQATALPAARRGALWGWITYLLSLPCSLHGA